MTKKEEKAIEAVKDETPLDLSSLSPTELAEIEAMAKENAKYIEDSCHRVSIQGSVYKVNEHVLGTGSTFEAEILRQTLVNTYYETGYDPANTTVPTCFSVGGHAPESTSTNKQADECSKCPKNEFGSGKNPDGTPGKGKACANQRRLILQIKDIELPCRLTLPPTSKRSMENFLRELQSIPFWGVLAKFSFDTKVTWPQPHIEKVRNLSYGELKYNTARRKDNDVERAALAFATSSDDEHGASSQDEDEDEPF